MPLQGLMETGYEALSAVAGKVPLETLKETLSDFIGTRFKFLMMEEGHNQEFVGAVLPSVAGDIYDGYMRLRALETQDSIEDFRRLMVGFKRVYNITKTLKDELPLDPVPHRGERGAGPLRPFRGEEGPFRAGYGRAAVRGGPPSSSASRRP